MTNASDPETAEGKSAPSLSYRGSLAGLKGLLTHKLAEGLNTVVTSVADMKNARREGEGGTVRLSMENIYPSADQPRQVFDPRSLEELSQTLKELGQAQAITVRKTPQGYEIISGERRYRAAKLAGFTELDCVIKDCSPREARLLALVENMQRQDLLPIEEAHYLRKVLEENPEMNLERLAKALGSHKSTLSEKIQLTEVPEALQPLLYSRGRHVTHRHWRVISRISDVAFLNDVFLKTVDNHLSVAELEQLLKASGIQKASRRRAKDLTGEGATAEKPIFRLDGDHLKLRSVSLSWGDMERERREKVIWELEELLGKLKSIL